ncbi:hypothetical protein ACE1CI_30460, partial [Aerosakkonemataceae cyanobacterium BLCC-F50]
MPGFEYDTIITKVDGVGQKIDNELVGKKFESADINNPLNDLMGSLLPVLGAVSAGAFTTIKIPVAGAANNIVSFTRMQQLSTAVSSLSSTAQAGQAATSGILQGGIRGILSFGKMLLPLVAQIVAVIAALAFTAWEIWNTFDTIGQSVSHLYEAKAELEVKVGSFEAKMNRIEAENRALKTGLATLERTTNQQLQQQATKIQNLEAEVAGLETLIKNNHAQSMQQLNTV